MRKEQCIKFLEQDKILNVCLIECLKHEDVELIEEIENGVMFTLKDSKITMVSGKVEEKFLLKAKNSKHYFTPCKNIADKLKAVFNKDYNCCKQVIYYNQDKIVNSEYEYKILQPTIENATLISKNYSLNYTVEEVLKVLENKVMMGAFVGGEMAGFIGMHEERSIGMLEVFKKYQRLGIGTDLIIKMVEFFNKNNFVPFCHIFATNEKSLSLHRKLNTNISNFEVYWL